MNIDKNIFALVKINKGLNSNYTLFQIGHFYRRFRSQCIPGHSSLRQATSREDASITLICFSVCAVFLISLLPHKIWLTIWEVNLHGLKYVIIKKVLTKVCHARILNLRARFSSFLFGKRLSVTMSCRMQGVCPSQSLSIRPQLSIHLYPSYG